MNTQEQLEKLARTLVNSGLVSTPGAAMKKAREMLKVKEPEIQEKVDITTLPKIDDIKTVKASISVGVSDLDKDKTLKEVIEEDAKKIYDKQSESDNKQTD